MNAAANLANDLPVMIIIALWWVLLSVADLMFPHRDFGGEPGSARPHGASAKVTGAVDAARCAQVRPGLRSPGLPDRQRDDPAGFRPRRHGNAPPASVADRAGSLRKCHRRTPGKAGDARADLRRFRRHGNHARRSVGPGDRDRCAFHCADRERHPFARRDHAWRVIATDEG